MTTETTQLPPCPLEGCEAVEHHWHSLIAQHDILHNSEACKSTGDGLRTKLTGEPTEDEIDRAADVLAAHGYRVTWDWYPFCTCGWRADQPRDVASYDRHVARAALRAARGLS